MKKNTAVGVQVNVTSQPKKSYFSVMPGQMVFLTKEDQGKIVPIFNTKSTEFTGQRGENIAVIITMKDDSKVLYYKRPEDSLKDFKNALRSFGGGNKFSRAEIIGVTKGTEQSKVGKGLGELQRKNRLMAEYVIRRVAGKGKMEMPWNDYKEREVDQWRIGQQEVKQGQGVLQVDVIPTLLDAMPEAKGISVAEKRFTPSTALAIKLRLNGGKMGRDAYEFYNEKKERQRYKITRISGSEIMRGQAAGMPLTVTKAESSQINIIPLAVTEITIQSGNIFAQQYNNREIAKKEIAEQREYIRSEHERLTRLRRDFLKTHNVNRGQGITR